MTFPASFSLKFLSRKLVTLSSRELGSLAPSRRHQRSACPCAVRRVQTQRTNFHLRHVRTLSLESLRFALGSAITSSQGHGNRRISMRINVWRKDGQGHLDFSRPVLARRFCAIAASTNRPSAHPLLDIHCRPKGGRLYKPARYSILCLSNPNVRECAKDVESGDSILPVRYSGVCFLRSKIVTLSRSTPRGDIRSEEPPEYISLVPVLLSSSFFPSSFSLSCTYTNQHDFHRNQRLHLTLDRQPPPQNW
jgi:hypothetical protein